LVCLLPKPESFDMALFALQSIGGEAAAHALVCQLACADEAHKVAIITALGVIASPTPGIRPAPPCCCGATPEQTVCVATLIVPVLLREAQQYNGATATAAIDALGRIGAIDAASLLWRRIQAHPDDVPAVNAYLKIAEKQSPHVATTMYLKTLKSTADHTTVTAALQGLGAKGDATVVNTLVRHLRVADRADVYGAAVDALTRLHGPNVDETIQRAAAKANPETRSKLLEILEARKQAPPKNET